MQIRFFKNAHIVQYAIQTARTSQNVPGTKKENGASLAVWFLTGDPAYNAPFDLSRFTSNAVKATNDEYNFDAYNCNQVGSTVPSSAVMNNDKHEATILLKVTAGDSDAVFSKFYFFAPFYKDGTGTQKCLQWCIDLEKEVTVPAGTSKDFSYTLKWV